MPKETYFNLKEEKREKIEKALEKEFGRVPFEKASISNIITEAEIPRGSFYQYFEDKEDAITYIVQKYITLEHKMMSEFLIKTQGNIFEMAIQVFEYMTNNTIEKEKVNLYKNIMKEIKKNNINVLEEARECEDKHKVEQIIDTHILKLQKKEDIKYIMKILISVTRTTGIEVVENKISIEQGRKDLKEQLDILKRGMCKD